MSNIFKLHGGKIIAGGGVVAGAYIFLMPGSSTPSLFRTPGVKNIEDRYSSGGGSKHHTPGAGTMRGNSEDVAPKADPTNDKSGMGSKEWQEKIGEQKPEPSTFEKAWNKTHYGTEKGK